MNKRLKIYKWTQLSDSTTSIRQITGCEKTENKKQFVSQVVSQAVPTRPFSTDVRSLFSRGYRRCSSGNRITCVNGNVGVIIYDSYAIILTNRHTTKLKVAFHLSRREMLSYAKAS